MNGLLGDGALHRLIGAVAGTLVSLAYMLPKSRSQLWRRAFVSLLTGLAAAGAIADKLNLPENHEGIMSAAFLGAVGAWGALAALSKITRAWQGPKAADE